MLSKATPTLVMFIVSIIPAAQAPIRVACLHADQSIELLCVFFKILHSLILRFTFTLIKLQSMCYEYVQFHQINVNFISILHKKNGLFLEQSLYYLGLFI